MKLNKAFLVTVLLFLAVIPVASAQLVPRSWEWEVAKRNVPGYEWDGISSHSEVVDTNEWVIWCADRAYIFPTVATIMNVSSADVDDTAGGNGLWNVTIYGLNASRDPITEIVQMNGQNPVSTTQQFLRVNRMVGCEAGSTGTNEGDVYIGVGATVAGEPATVYHVICIGEGWSHVGVYSVKDGYTAFLVRGIFGTDDAKQVTFAVNQRSTTNPDSAWQMVIHFHVEQQYIYPSEFYQRLPPDADILVKSSVTVADASVMSKISLLLIDNDVLNNSTLLWVDGTVGETLTSDPTNNALLYLLILFLIVALLAVGRK